MNSKTNIQKIKYFIVLVATLLLSKNTLSQTTVTLTAGPGVSTDAVIGFYTPLNYQNINFGKSQEFLSKALSVSSSCSIARSMIRFDLSSIPNTASVLSASLSLYYNPTASNPPHSGANSSYLKTITSAWVDTLVTWNTQPSTTTLGQVIIPQSTVSTQNYLDINVTSLIASMVVNPATNFGMELGLVNETCSRNLTFCSGKHATPSLRPKLVITYSNLAGINEISNQNILKVYPNPSAGIFEFKTEGVILAEIELANILGEKVYSKKLAIDNSKIDISSYSNGVYTYQIKTLSGEIIVGKLVKH